MLFRHFTCCNDPNMKLFGPHHNHVAPITFHKKGTKVCYCKRRDSATIDKCEEDSTKKHYFLLSQI